MRWFFYDVFPAPYPYVYAWFSAFPVDPMNKEYWQTYGLYDCNGNYGEGNYCFCQSQGYNCACEPVEWFEDTPRLECYDHIGRDCAGNIVEGEDQWCPYPDSKYYSFD